AAVSLPAASPLSSCWVLPESCANAYGCATRPSAMARPINLVFMGETPFQDGRGYFTGQTISGPRGACQSVVYARNLHAVALQHRASSGKLARGRDVLRSGTIGTSQRGDRR